MQFEIANKKILDPFAGSGALCLEAMSRGAKEVYLIEKNKKVSDKLASNFKILNSSQYKIINQDSLIFLEMQNKNPFDLVFLDPPFEKNLLNFYKEGYDYQWDIKQNIFGRPIQFVKLIPSSEDKEIKYLLLGIDVVKKTIYRLIEIGSNGTRTTLTLSNQMSNTTLKEDFFTFDVSRYPDYYINLKLF